MQSKTGRTAPYRVAIVFPADPEQRHKTRLEESRFARTAAALAEKGIAVEGAAYVADDVEGLRERLMRVDGVLVWINPIVEGRDRTHLNKALAEVAASGVFVSAHPDVIAKMGTKEVLFRTRTMGWGCDTRQYPTFAAMQRDLPESLATGEARILKRARGHSGDGVWKVNLQIKPVPEPPPSFLRKQVYGSGMPSAAVSRQRCPSPRSSRNASHTSRATME